MSAKRLIYDAEARRQLKAGIDILANVMSTSSAHSIRPTPPRAPLGARAFADLDAHQELVLGSGHVEHEGMVVLSSFSEPDHTAPIR